MICWFILVERERKKLNTYLRNFFGFYETFNDKGVCFLANNDIFNKIKRNANRNGSVFKNIFKGGFPLGEFFRAKRKACFDSFVLL